MEIKLAELVGYLRHNTTKQCYTSQNYCAIQKAKLVPLAVYLWSYNNSHQLLTTSGMLNIVGASLSKQINYE